MQPKTFDEHLAESRRRTSQDRIVAQRYPVGPDEWSAEIAVAESALAVLLRRVQVTRGVDFRREQLLWRRHHEDLWRLKRMLDAVVM